MIHVPTLFQRSSDVSKVLKLHLLLWVEKDLDHILSMGPLSPIPKARKAVTTEALLAVAEQTTADAARPWWDPL